MPDFCGEVLLDQCEIMLAMQTGACRQFMNEASKDRAYYDRSKMRPDWQAQTCAVLAEIAVAKYLGVYCIPTLWPRSKHAANAGSADIGEVVEVRAIFKPDNCPGVRVKDVGRWIVCCHVDPDSDLTTANIVGAKFIPDTDAMRSWIEKQEADEGYARIPQEKLQPIEGEVLEALQGVVINHLS